jgi:hypothetical protein
LNSSGFHGEKYFMCFCIKKKRYRYEDELGSKVWGY